MASVRVLLALSAAGALVIGASLAPGAREGMVGRAGHTRAAPGQAASHPAAPVSPVLAASRHAPWPVPRLVSPRPGAAIHLTFPRTWRPATLEVGSPVQRPPLRVFCVTCPPGTVLEVDL